MTRSHALVEPYGHYINGEWVEADSGRYDDIDPATGDVFATAPDAGTAQVERAIAAAREAFDSGRWTGLSPEERSECLQQLGTALLEHAEDFYALAQIEWGCTANERMIHIEGPAVMMTHAGELALEPVEQPIDAWGASGTTLLRYEPLGVVAVLTPWNFPHTLNAMKIGSALAAGNTVVLKPSPLTPLAGLALARMIDEHTDIPPGVVNVVTPSGVEPSKLLTTDPRIDMVSFTGSSAVGREVMAGAATGMKRILLECGGKSAGIFLDDVEITDELLQKVLFECLTMHAGQACILNSRLLLPESLHDDVVARLAELARNVVVGNPADPAVEMGPLISQAHLDRVDGFVRRAVADGATVVTGGSRADRPERGFFYEPTILTGVRPDDYIAQEEVFGPVLTVLRYRDDDEAVAIANNSAYGLGGAVYGSDVDRALAVARRIRTGQVSINGCIAGDAPFGGFGQSGIGREGGVLGLRNYMEPKAIGVPA
ncbi:aldehyde dehydrogenase family protein [Mycolicibacterium hassiacum DSM 44199]|jgi:predicted outer membrane repeat protein|uniref:Aldehyde dehydrogenase family protein n=1 Tax=Mycolicibacterium hassiacum (strain DSM 44199 / CIP 105218 / JCM 12690 / 3849) TaxID=1122247 RepID=K5BIE4_MYCHD|nr:aldehyde dehydrogenase family protein [Mycolicibacterium hassiacum]EKF21219.1 aldehyde dehydrogenase family protein [Mycolicibacterium hassiacum DSM 44199]MBX5487572.1 aldehyde dehydrogenase family protein [Mycolicibacterium hassiacum]MDA4085048.1 aldehyde dehydrogenase [Mycolicibacterium hassiacum DSM 44199]PZN22970.1 MAG: aldehyde dehydrogenase [Mycolicibacterium hassiacum]VCT89037.1 Putative aldehyde dehydrogenase AldA [Mycolicibacterium hassiacum DSM 44199]